MGAASASPDANGYFRIRLIRFMRSAPATIPDTMTVWVLGFTQFGDVEGRPVAMDSARVTLEFAPVGATPVPAEVVIRLAAH